MERPESSQGDDPDGSSRSDNSSETHNPGGAPLAKTPLYQAMHAARYQRQDLVREIQSDTKNKLICYVAGIYAPVDREDVICFFDLLRNIRSGQNVDLLLQTGGGDIDAAEKVITMVRNRVGKAQLRVIVPDYAKSAGTLMALGADVIVMSDTSELGPIDPQIVRTDRNGNRIWHSIMNYLDAYEKHRQELEDNPNDMAATIMFEKLDPDTVLLYQSMRDRARKCAEGQLKLGMMSDGGNFTQAAAILLDTTKFRTHGQPIPWDEAGKPGIGLNVDHRSPDDPFWLRIWQLYCLQVLAVGDAQKLFESEIVSICIDSRAV